MPDDQSGLGTKLRPTDAAKTSCSREINQVYKTPNVDTTPFIDPSPFEIK